MANSPMLYCLPRSAIGIELVSRTTGGGAGFTTIVRDLSADLDVASVTVTVNEKPPAEAGVPETKPVFGFRVTPPGRAPALRFQA